MTFPNAVKGVKTLHIAAYIGLIMSVISLIAPTFSMLYMAVSSQPSNENGIVGFILVMLVYSIVLGTVAYYVISLIGVNLASKDESSFKVAFYAIIFGIIITIIGGVFSSNEAIKGLTDILYNITNIISAIYIIQGVVFLSKALGNHKMKEQGNHIIRIISVIYVFQIFTSVSMVIFGDLTQSIVSAILTEVVGILSIAEYVLFLMYLSKTKKMLSEQ